MHFICFARKLILVLYLRLTFMSPQRVNSIKLSRNIESSSYQEIYRDWNKADVIELQLPSNPQLASSKPNIEETCNQVAVKYGSVIYCLEAKDLPKGIDTMGIVVSQDITFESSYDADMLSGVVVLKGLVQILPKEKWEGSLYKPLTIKYATDIPIKLVPYFA